MMPIPRKVSLGGHSLNSVGSSHCGSASSSCSTPMNRPFQLPKHHPGASMKQQQQPQLMQQQPQQPQQLPLQQQQPQPSQVSCRVKVEPMENSSEEDSGNSSGGSTSSTGLRLIRGEYCS